MAEFRLTPAAEGDLEGIWDYTRKQWSEEQADRYLDAMAMVFGELAKAPQSAPACDHIRAGYRRRRVERHMIYFRVTAYGVAIVRILHDRMDAARHL